MYIGLLFGVGFMLRPEASRGNVVGGLALFRRGRFLIFFFWLFSLGFVLAG